jgi:hypothetical protein
VEYASKGNSIKCLSLLCQKLLQNEQSLNETIRRQKENFEQSIHQLAEVKRGGRSPDLNSAAEFSSEISELNQNLRIELDHRSLDFSFLYFR